MVKYFNLNSDEPDRNLINVVRLSDLFLMTLEQADIDNIFGRDSIITGESMEELLDPALLTQEYIIKHKGSNSIIIKDEENYGYQFSVKPSSLNIKPSDKTSKFTQENGYLGFYINGEEFLVLDDLRPNEEMCEKLRKDNIQLRLHRIYTNKMRDICILFDLMLEKEGTPMLDEKSCLLEMTFNFQYESIISINSNRNFHLLEDFELEIKEFKTNKKNKKTDKQEV